MQTMTEPTTTKGDVTVRPVEPPDADECARIVHEAFGAVHDHHRFERDFPSLEAAVQLRAPLSRIRPSVASLPRATAGCSARTSLTSAARSADSDQSPSTPRHRASVSVAG